jgi:hypothetical protein
MQDGTNLCIVQDRLLHYRTNLLLPFCEHFAVVLSVRGGAQN